jgi:hypothetical protein
MRGFQSRNRLFPGHGRKGVQEFVEAVIPREIVDEVPERHPRTSENGLRDMGTSKAILRPIAVEAYRGLQPAVGIRNALSDPSMTVRRFAQRAIDRIDVP